MLAKRVEQQKYIFVCLLDFPVYMGPGPCAQVGPGPYGPGSYGPDLKCIGCTQVYTPLSAGAPPPRAPPISRPPASPKSASGLPGKGGNKFKLCFHTLFEHGFRNFQGIPEWIPSQTHVHGSVNSQGISEWVPYQIQNSSVSIQVL